MREQRVVLEHHADVALRGIELGDVGLIDQDPSLIRGLEARDDLQQRRLAGPAGAENGDELAGGNAEADVRERRHLAEALARRVDLQAARLR